MIFWTREIAGWVLVGFGLAAFWAVYQFSFQYHFVYGILFLVMGVFLFRGGIHLLKVAVAARACREAQERLYPDAAQGSAPLPTARTHVRAGWRA
jgi:hypothetical protein